MNRDPDTGLLKPGLLEPHKAPNGSSESLKALARKPLFWVILALIVIGGIATRDMPRDAPAPLTQPRATTTGAVASTYRPPPAFANIKSWTPAETDCVNLQSWFNGADNMGERARDAGDLDAAKWYTALMGQIDNRMESVGCY